jgi:glycerol-3-phosphate acyltransferase PlsY
MSAFDRNPSISNDMGMDAFVWPGLVVLAYLFGSLNFAIVVTRVVTGDDIRNLGNHNPGAANVGRSLGTGWGALVLILDIAKSTVPMLLARSLMTSAREEFGPIVLLTVGMAAVLGHCKPIYFRFRGGRGIATAIGVYLVLVPVEALIALFGAAGLVAVVIRNVDHKFGPYTPIFFVSLAPLLTVVTSLWLHIPVIGSITIGGHSWYAVGCVLAVSLGILALNPSYLARRVGDYRAGRDPSHADEK